jgi:hypothetical protein
MHNAFQKIKPKGTRHGFYPQELWLDGSWSSNDDSSPSGYGSTVPKLNAKANFQYLSSFTGQIRQKCKANS